MWPKRKASSEIPSHELVIIQDRNDLGPGGEERTKQNLEHRTSKKDQCNTATTGFWTSGMHPLLVKFSKLSRDFRLNRLGKQILGYVR